MSAGTESQVEVFDGEDLACGELLLRLVSYLKGRRAGTVVRIVATDPAAPIDLPFWCHLTGHDYLGTGQSPDGRPYFDIMLQPGASATVPGKPWRLDNAATAVPPARP